MLDWSPEFNEAIWKRKNMNEAISPPSNPGQIRPLRIWIAVFLLALLWVLRIVPGYFEDQTIMHIMAQFMGPLVCAGLIVLWWLILSRATGREKLTGFLGLLIVGVGSLFLADKSVRGFGTLIFAVPWGFTGFVVPLILFGHRLTTKRTWIGLLGAFVCFGFWDLVRTDEIWGDFRTTRSWRWEPSAEDRNLEKIVSRSAAETPALDATQQPVPDSHDWPAFRGAERRGIQPDIILEEDWSKEKPIELWRVPVGPGWSSFSVSGSRIFTQEQRGEKEAVVCYDANTGTQMWSHEYESRFWEAVAGAGPRGTPTLEGDRVFALGATGKLFCLDYVTGSLVWEADISVDAEREPPTWGFAASPLVIDSSILVHAGGKKDKGVLAYDAASGELQWSVAAGDHSYSSPQLSVIGEKSCVVMLTNEGVSFIDPKEGVIVGKHGWVYQGYRVVQPLVVANSNVLLGTAMGTGTMNIQAKWNGDKIETEEVWVSRRMNPYYNDYVEHGGYLYGFDNNIFACVNLEDGKREWKRGRYGNGQVLLLPEKEQLLVLSEDGELVLLRATPEKHTELARFQVLEGRTWNHPVLVKNRLYVRNAEEAACFEMPIQVPITDENASISALD